MAGILIHDASGRLMFADGAAARAHGFESARELLHADPASAGAALDPGFTTEAIRVLGRDGSQPVVSVLHEVGDGARGRGTADPVGRLVDVVSHDLRNPLSVIVTAVALLLKAMPRTEKDGRMRRQVEAIGRAARRIGRLARELPDLASVHRGALCLERGRHLVAGLLGEAVSAMQSAAQEKQVDLVEGAVVPDLRVLCDRNRILHVLSSVVGSAIDLAPEQGIVNVSAEPLLAGREVCFIVRDGGAPRLSAAGPESGARGEPVGADGVGIGLFVTRGIVEAHGGRLWTEGSAGGCPAFYFTLPSAKGGDEGGGGPAPAGE